MQVVYIDTLFFINFTVNYLMLLLTAKILQCSRAAPAHRRLGGSRRRVCRAGRV